MNIRRPTTLVLSLFVLLLAACSMEADPNAEDSEAASPEALSGYSRQAVYTEVKPHAKAARDLLSSSETDARLVSAIGWLHDNAPGFTLSAIRSDHHNDGPSLHAGGFCADLYANDTSQMKKLVEAVNKNPWVSEIGLGGSYKSLKGSVTRKAYFDDNGQTHIHIGVKRAAGRCRSGHCDGEASATAAATTAPSSSASVPLPTPRPDDLGTCKSFTLQENVQPGTCVQRADDDNWYVCDADDLGAWPMVDGPTDAQCTSCPQLENGVCAGDN